MTFMFFSQISFAMENSFNSKSPIDILSDKVTYYTEKNIAVFEGDVVATQDDMTLKCEIMEVILEKKSENKSDDKESDDQSRNIKHIYMKNNVEIFNPREKATSDFAEYIVADEKFIMISNVVLTQEGSILRGDKLIYLKNTGETQVISNNQSQRVKGTFVPKQQKESEVNEQQ